MQTIPSILETRLRSALTDFPGAEPRVNAAADARFGDYQTNAAMVLAKAAGKSPRALAERIAPLLASDPHIDKVEIAGPGFINLTLALGFWPSVLRMVLEQGDSYGRSAIGKGEAVNLEYVSANPTGPMHVGHTRGAVFGDALANLLAFVGFAVTREYYVNDAGAQVDALARQVELEVDLRFVQSAKIDVVLISEFGVVNTSLAIELEGGGVLTAKIVKIRNVVVEACRQG